MSRSRGVAVPYGVPSLVRDIVDAEGTVAVFNEVFDAASWALLPSRVRVCRGHWRNSPLGWGSLSETDEGLIVDVEWLDSGTGRDAFAEVRSGLMPDLSISFRADLKRDKVTREPGRVPTVLRRGCELVEVSVVYAGAHKSAKITVPDLDAATPAVAVRTSWSAEDAALLGYGVGRIRHRLQAQADQAAADVALLRSLDELQAAGAAFDRRRAEARRDKRPRVHARGREWFAAGYLDDYLGRSWVEKWIDTFALGDGRVDEEALRALGIEQAPAEDPVTQAAS